ncbi:hypothetical protein BK133_08750 [Paenibacillus sp. FSL H8-0548]|uniref:HAD-IA family hydrolase n=1 Tax=Paenibacillus sp. FSL H8-0548 TaxID=1920422 RepID=UPI00096F2418|nr:HAD-IA family hydrolase [Paenibacillus sp. FSL H8-0548]OMF36723.1 hypothetical protein BK133_08750 [Paenibacillus sp. FSL H8-0548]
MMRPQLVLDIGGVLATNLSPLLWQLLAAEAAVSEDTLYFQYKQEISEQLWTGHISEAQFWKWITAYAPSLTMKQAKAIIEQSLRPLPALEKIAEWSVHADIHLLSNHLSAWVEPIVLPIKPYLKSVTISSEAALKKPDRAIFTRLAAQLPQSSYVLFIDDQNKNIEQAASLGWHTLLADESGGWISLVHTLLQKAGEQEQC